MKLENVKFTLLVSREGTTLEIHDRDSSTTFVRLKISPEEFLAALGRQAYCKAESAEVFALERVGKVMIMDKLIFEMPKGVDYEDRTDTAKKIAIEKCPAGWEPDNYYGSKDSFYEKNGKTYARTTIRKWVDADSEEGKAQLKEKNKLNL